MGNCTRFDRLATSGSLKLGPVKRTKGVQSPVVSDGALPTEQSAMVGDNYLGRLTTTIVAG